MSEPFSKEIEALKVPIITWESDPRPVDHSKERAEGWDMALRLAGEIAEHTLSIEAVLAALKINPYRQDKTND